MESLEETPWDVTISGTGIAQSLLALALSRSGKKVLHVDKNPYYGGSDAALSLQEAEEWASEVNKATVQLPFEDATVYSPSDSGLSPSRAYTLSLSPQLIYSRSQLVPTLVSSRVYRQLEFQAVGSWWIYKPTASGDKDLYRVPSSREDVFADEFISMKSKRTLMKFLRNLGQSQLNQESSQEESPAQDDLSKPLPEYLTSKFQVPPELYDPLLSLSLSQAPAQKTLAQYAVPRIQRHLTSIGVFGPGFGSVLVKWGGGSEISQVGCRALAVGGGVYVLNSGIESLNQDSQSETDDQRVQLRLLSGETITTQYVVGSNWDLPSQTQAPCDYDQVSRSISIVSSSLDDLFPATAESGPIPAGAVVVFPASSLGLTDESPPVYISVHSSETAECPAGQSILYSSVSIPGQQGQSLIEGAIEKLLQSRAGPNAKVLWSLRYTQLGRAVAAGGETLPANLVSGRVIRFPPPSLDLAFDDSIIDLVKDAWTMVMGDEASKEIFMKFEDREDYDDEE
ncbi:putative Rab geranylgeranyl transferase escort protein [Aspergillus undulatus]|uniref:putative Rab geranylgeranyl transferase escort protein n=1 Tax=Aspergillus undulatus TaxID=1810928 RepID=UPI003CCD50B5